jgi:hypothetical protein
VQIAGAVFDFAPAPEGAAAGEDDVDPEAAPGEDNL